MGWAELTLEKELRNGLMLLNLICPFISQLKALSEASLVRDPFPPNLPTASYR